MLTPAYRRYGVLFAAFAVLAVLLVPHAVPVFAQDWAWPLTRGQGAQLARVSTGIWRDAGFGSPWTAPNSWLAGTAIGIAVWLAGPYVALVAFLLALIATALFGTAALLGACGAAGPGRILGAVAYAASPVFLNKLHAGHTYYLIGFACMPAACWAVVRAARGVRGAALTAGLLLAACAFQFQFYEICGLAIAIVGLAIGGRRAIGPLAIAYAVAAIAHAPDYAVMFGAARNVLFFPTLANAVFEHALSTPPAEAFAQFAYIGGYAASAFGPALPTAENAVDAALAAAAALALTGAARDRSGAALRLLAAGVALGVVGACLTAGYEGPLGAALAAVFAHAPLATAFREFYHQAALTALGTALVVGAAASVRTGPLRALATVPALVTIAAFGFAIVRDPVDASASFDASLAARVSAVPGRTLYLPGAPSLGAASEPAIDGVDSFQQSEGRSVPVTYTSDPTRLAYWYGPGASYVPRTAARFGWTAIVTRAGVDDRYRAMLDPDTRARLGPLPPPLALDALPAGASETVRDVRAVRTTHDVVAGVPTWPDVASLPPGRHLVSPVPETAPSFDLARLGSDPALGLAQSERYLPAVPSLSCLPMPAFFRLRGSSGVATGSSCAWRYVAVGNRACLEAVTPEIAAHGPCTDRRDGPAHVAALAADVRARRTALYYVPQSFDAGWRLACADGSTYAPNVLVDGYAAGWSLPRCDAARASFPLDATFRILAIAAACALAITLALERLAGARAGTRRTRVPRA